MARPGSDRWTALSPWSLAVVSSLSSSAAAQGIKLNPPLVRDYVGDVVEARVSPDSSRVVYLADQNADELLELYSVPLAGGAATQLNGALAANGDVRAGFAISADSSRVVYLADQDADELVELFSVPIGGGTVTQLNPTLVANGDVRSFQISADSARVVYRADQDVDEVIELFSVPLTGGAATQLNGALPPFGDVLDASDFAISPDSTRVVYRADQITGGVLELFSVPIGGGTAVRINASLVAGGDVSDGFAFSPDSSHVVYLADQAVNELFELFSVPIDGGAVAQLNGTLVAGGDVQSDFQVTPDSSQVVYRADQNVDGTPELFGVGLGGGPATQLNAVVSSGGVPAFRIAPDASRVVFWAHHIGIGTGLFSVPLAGGPMLFVSDSAGVDFEITLDSTAVVYLGLLPPCCGEDLAIAPITGGPSTVLSGFSASSEEVEEFVLSPDGLRVVFRANGTDSFRLFSVSLAGGPGTQLHPSLGSFGDIQSGFLISPDASRAVYVADQREDGVLEVFSTPLGAGTSTLLNGQLAQTGGTAGDVERVVPSPDGRWVVYHADQDVDDSLGIYSIGLAGSPPIRLDDAQQVRSFGIAPDSAHVVYTDEGSVPHGVPIGGGAAIALGPPSVEDNPYFLFSGDSSLVVYAAKVDDDIQLLSVPITGGAATLLSGATGVVVNPPGSDPTFWSSPDSSRVVYLGWESTGVIELFSASLTGGPPTKLNQALPASADVLGAVRVSADSARVVYAVFDATPALLELYSVPLAGGAAVHLNGALVAGGDVQQDEFQISPDSARVVYVADQDTDNVFELYSVPIGGGPSTKLNVPLPPGRGVVSDLGSNNVFVISPDSSRVLYVADQDTNDVFELYRAPIDGSAAPQKLNGALVAGGDVGFFQGPVFLELVPPRISADGAWVVYGADEDTNERFELFAVPMDGGPSTKLNLALPATADVERDFAISADSRRVVYRTQYDLTRGPQLYGVTLTGAFTTRQLNPTLIAGGTVESFHLDRDKVFYLADQDEVDVVELYLSFLTRPHVRFPAPTEMR